MPVRTRLAWLTVLLALAPEACQDNPLAAPPDPYHLLAGGSAGLGFAQGDEFVPVHEATSSDAGIVQVAIASEDTVTLSGVAEGEARVTVRTGYGVVDFTVIVQAADRFELYRRSFPWPPCERFVPGGSEWIEDATWFRGGQELNGRPPSTAYSTTDPAVATVSTDPWGMTTLSYLAPGTVNLLESGRVGPTRTVVAVDDLAGLALWAECSGQLIGAGADVAPIWIDCGTTAFFVTGLDANDAMVCFEGAPTAADLRVEAPDDPECDLTPFTSTSFHLRRATPGSCEVALTLGELGARVSVPFGSDGP